MSVKGKRIPLACLAGVLACVVSLPARAALPTEGGMFMLPMNCSELLPDMAPYLNFFEAVARGQVKRDKRVSERLYRVLSLREIYLKRNDRLRGQNPIDVLIRKTLCFYREQKEPLKPTAYDDAGFLKYLRGALRDLEGKVDDVIFTAEFERQEREKYEKRLQANQEFAERVRKQADAEASRTYEKLESAARRRLQKE